MQQGPRTAKRADAPRRTGMAAIDRIERALISRKLANGIAVMGRFVAVGDPGGFGESRPAHLDRCSRAVAERDPSSGQNDTF